MVDVVGVGERKRTRKERLTARVAALAGGERVVQLVRAVREDAVQGVKERWTCAHGRAVRRACKAREQAKAGAPAPSETAIERVQAVLFGTMAAEGRGVRHSSRARLRTRKAKRDAPMSWSALGSPVRKPLTVPRRRRSTESNPCERAPA